MNSEEEKKKETEREREIEEEVVRLLSERRSVPFVMVAVKSRFDCQILREEIEKIRKKSNVDEILRKEDEKELSALLEETQIARFEYFEAKFLYDKLMAALHGCDSHIRPADSLRKICDVYDRMVAAMDKYRRVKQEAEDLIGYKFGEGKVNWFRNIFDRLTGAPRQIATPAASAAPAPANLFSESSIAGD